MKPTVIHLQFMGTELVVKLVMEVKSIANFPSPYIDYHFGLSSPITQNLVSENALLSWSTTREIIMKQ